MPPTNDAAVSFHEPVMVEEVLHYLLPPGDGVFVDGTLGGGGHGLQVMRHAHGAITFIGIDRDPDALTVARDILGPHAERCRLVHGSYRDMGAILRAEGLEGAHGVLLDIGVSWHQLATADRGFSFMREGPLDMRFDQTKGAPVRTMLREWTHKELARILEDYGELGRAAKLATRLQQESRVGGLETTADLVRVIRETPGFGKRRHHDPATLVFQALRIAVNDELGALADVLGSLDDILAPGGRMGIISYHSLEDRMVKRAFKAHAKDGGYTLVTKKPVPPGAREVRRNAKARSAKLRVIERDSHDGEEVAHG